ncbi:hypothetical protein WMY93_001751 [Mugilogobius chulae]|uniref:Fibronectin type-III domain-containing protein n=1 Tax=Mugilogobius chulae TaxID=88201 RepID=A0AAW0PS88_9GOBI
MLQVESASENHCKASVSVFVYNLLFDLTLKKNSPQNIVLSSAKALLQHLCLQMECTSNKTDISFSETAIFAPGHVQLSSLNQPGSTSLHQKGVPELDLGDTGVPELDLGDTVKQVFMLVWILLLLLLDHGKTLTIIKLCVLTAQINMRHIQGDSVCVPDPVNVSIWSFNLEHILQFVPGPETPGSALFTVQALSLSEGRWTDVDHCARMNAGQQCNLTLVLKDPLDGYQVRVRAFTPTLSSKWTESALFQPMSDTVLGPPRLKLSGCGNCLLLRVSPPLLKTDQWLSLFSKVVVQVQRSSDGAQFELSVPLTDEIRVEHLQRGVEYCVTVAVHDIYNDNSTPSKQLCALSSSPDTAPLLLVCLVAVLSMLLLCLLGWLLLCSPGSRTCWHFCSPQI